MAKFVNTAKFFNIIHKRVNDCIKFMINYNLKKCINSDFARANDVPNNTKITIIQKIGHIFRQRKNREY